MDRWWWSLSFKQEVSFKFHLWTRGSSLISCFREDTGGYAGYLILSDRWWFRVEEKVVRQVFCSFDPLELGRKRRNGEVVSLFSASFEDSATRQGLAIHNSYPRTQLNWHDRSKETFAFLTFSLSCCCSFLVFASPTKSLGGCWLPHPQFPSRSRMASPEKIIWSIIWLLLLIFISIWLAFLSALVYIVVSIFTPCISGLQGLQDLALQGINFPHTCSSNMMSGKTSFWWRRRKRMSITVTNH